MEYTREVSDKLIEAFNKKQVFTEIVEFVKKHDDLALCFRGNDRKFGTVKIYRNNHKVWELYLSEERPIVKMNLTTARFTKNWDKQVMELDKLGFKILNSDNNDVRLVKRSGSNGKYEYKPIELEYKDDNIKSEILEKAYDISVEFQNDYFQEDIFDKEYFNKPKPKDYFKDYFLNNYEKDEINRDSKRESKKQRKLEKHIQQEIFTSNHEFENGMFIYDLEFHQPQKKDKPVPKDNEPDMFGIRFGSDGKPESICMIEVKSTEDAVKDKSTNSDKNKNSSGLKSHLIGMEQYIKDSELMEDRMREACRILNQYRDLKLYGVDNREEFQEDDFLKLNKEIVFILTNEVNLDTTIKDDSGNDVKIGVFLEKNGYEPDKDNIKRGPHVEPMVVLKKKYK